MTNKGFIYCTITLSFGVCVSVCLSVSVSVSVPMWYMHFENIQDLSVDFIFTSPLVYILGQTEALPRHSGSINTLHYKGNADYMTCNVSCDIIQNDLLMNNLMSSRVITFACIC